MIQSRESNETSLTATRSEKVEEIRALENIGISAVIVNYNGSDILNDCISTLLNQTRPPIEIIVVDNGSTDDSVKIVREKFPQVNVQECRANLGYAGGNNVGAKLARGEFVVLVNNDAELDSNCLEELSHVLTSEPDLVAVQGKVLRRAQPFIIDSIGSYLTPTGFLYHMGHNKRDTFDRESYIFSAKGVCMMIRRDLFHYLGEFDSDYFAYFEESDFCWRSWIAGYKVKLVPSSITYHRVGYTSTKLARGFIDYHSFKNRICSIIKNCGAWNLPFILASHLLLCVLIMGGLAARNQSQRASGVLRALVWNAANLRLTLKKRKSIQSELRKVSDREIFQKLLVSPNLRYYWNLFRGYL